MKKNDILNAVLVWSIILMLSAIVWFGDALIDKIFFYDESFEDIAVNNVPYLEIYFRSALIILLIIIGFVILKRMNEKNKANDLIEFEREQTLKIFDSIDEAIYIIDPKTFEILYHNKSVEKYFGEKESKKCFEYFHNNKNVCSECTMTRALNSKEGEIVVREYYNSMIDKWFHCIDKRIKWIDGRDVVYTLHIDITEKKRMEQEFYKASKFETLEVISETIVHDFNNILTTMMMSISVAKSFSQDNDKVTSLLSMAEDAAFRAKDITQQILTFTKNVEPQMESVHIERMIKQTAEFVLKNSGIEYGISYAEKLPQVEVDLGQIAQVMYNLIINAKQAIGENGKILINIEKKSIVKKDGYPISDGEYVMISVKDNGIGIDNENLQKIFNPYFTTKENGLGLGLASCYMIISKHKGYINVESEKGSGTVFKIFLPVSYKAEQITADAGVKNEIRGFRILLIDDDEIVVNITSLMLNYRGSHAETAHSAKAALNIYKNASMQGRPFDIVIMDLTLPDNKNPKTLLNEFRVFDPRVKSLILLGIDSEQIKEEFIDFGFNGALNKPFRAEELLKVISKILTN